MQPTPQLDAIAKRIRSLTVAVWVLAVLYGLQVVAWLAPVLAPHIYLSSVAPSSGTPRELFESWEGLSVGEKVKRASIVLITEYKEEDGKLRAIIKEELKREPGTASHYAVGDEYLPLTIVAEKNTRYGEGSLVLLQGSPATHRESYSIYNGSVPGLDEMPISKVRQVVEQSK